MNVISTKADNQYVYTLNFQNFTSQYFLVDSGATHSTMLYYDFEDLIHNNVEIEYIEGADSVVKCANNKKEETKLCVIKDVWLKGRQGELKIDNFYVYVMLINEDEQEDNKDIQDDTYDMAGLLGSTFIDMCEFEHRVGKSLKIINFDYEGYNQIYKELIKNKRHTLITDENKSIIFKCNDIAL